MHEPTVFTWHLQQTSRKKVLKLFLKPKQQLVKVRTMVVTGPLPPHGIWGTIAESTYNINLAKLWWTTVLSTHACGWGRKEGVEGKRIRSIPTFKYIYINIYIVTNVGTKGEHFQNEHTVFQNFLNLQVWLPHPEQKAGPHLKNGNSLCSAVSICFSGESTVSTRRPYSTINQNQSTHYVLLKYMLFLLSH